MSKVAIIVFIFLSHAVWRMMMFFIKLHYLHWFLYYYFYQYLLSFKFIYVVYVILLILYMLCFLLHPVNFNSLVWVTLELKMYFKRLLIRPLISHTTSLQSSIPGWASDSSNIPTKGQWMDCRCRLSLLGNSSTLLWIGNHGGQWVQI